MIENLKWFNSNVSNVNNKGVAVADISDRHFSCAHPEGLEPPTC
jgi:hypothetical protein